MRGPSRGRMSSRSSCGRSFKGGKPRAPLRSLCHVHSCTCTCNMYVHAYDSGEHNRGTKLPRMQPIHESWHPTLTLHRRVWTGRGVNHTVSTP